jgi:hypothetical protein
MGMAIQGREGHCPVVMLDVVALVIVVNDMEVLIFFENNFLIFFENNFPPTHERSFYRLTIVFGFV